MDPLSITAAVAGFIGLVGQTITYIDSVRHHKDDVRAFADNFEQIRSELQSLYALFEHINAQIAGSPGVSSPFAIDKSVRKQYARAKAMEAPGQERDKLEDQLNALLKKVSPSSGFLRVAKDAMLWNMKKREVSDDQARVSALPASMRNKLSDDHAEIQLDSWQMLRDLKSNMEIDQNLAILDWICADSIDRPLVRASKLALENTSFVRSDEIYLQWYEDKRWQMNCFGQPGTGKVRPNFSCT